MPRYATRRVVAVKYTSHLVQSMLSRLLPTWPDSQVAPITHQCHGLTSLAAYLTLFQPIDSKLTLVHPLAMLLYPRKSNMDAACVVQWVCLLTMVIPNFMAAKQACLVSEGRTNFYGRTSFLVCLCASWQNSSDLCLQQSQYF